MLRKIVLIPDSKVKATDASLSTTYCIAQRGDLSVKCIISNLIWSETKHTRVFSRVRRYHCVLDWVVALSRRPCY